MAESSEISPRTAVEFQLRTAGVCGAPPDPHRSGIHTRGYLPHVKCEGAAYFVTFRLDDSLPATVWEGFRRERDERLRVQAANPAASFTAAEIEREYRRRIERYLDHSRGACWLQRQEIARMVAESLRYFDGERYRLGDWVVMPNHVHVVVRPVGDHLLGDITKSWKSYTARLANRWLDRVGREFWQRESYDHWIRNDGEQSRIEGYIRRNPVVAGLCAEPGDWQWGSAHLRSPDLL